MTTITARIKGERKNLEMVLFSGVKNYSRKCLGVNTLFVSWICENTEDVMGEINQNMIELFNCELISLS